jgi:hypothetical protein
VSAIQTDPCPAATVGAGPSTWKVPVTVLAARSMRVAGNIESPDVQDNYAFTADKGQRIYLDVRECAATGTYRIKTQSR